jgi:hypothetical protein
MWTCEKEWNSPKAFSSHITTAIATTAFKTDLMVPCLGTNLFTSHNNIPATIGNTTIWIKDMCV